MTDINTDEATKHLDDDQKAELVKAIKQFNHDHADDLEGILHTSENMVTKHSNYINLNTDNIIYFMWSDSVPGFLAKDGSFYDLNAFGANRKQPATYEQRQYEFVGGIVYDEGMYLKMGVMKNVKTGQTVHLTKIMDEEDDTLISKMIKMFD